MNCSKVLIKASQEINCIKVECKFSMERKRNVLIVYAHHYNQSFNAALLKVAVKTLLEQHCDVTVSDLYAMNYDPLIGRKDIRGKFYQLYAFTKHE